MTASEIIKDVVFNVRKTSIEKLAKRIGVSRQALYMRLSRASPTRGLGCGQFVDMMTELGYCVIVIPMETLDRLYANEYLLTSDTSARRQENARKRNNSGDHGKA